ncbi:PHP domain-containing protein [Emticicia sp. BO119]|uniref:PHP domain-containing protein n=1 Tax=Emticicia sp. BO119 TaxID=2757768 RepID=UPI0015F0D424|nr:CehA/McbA family metallohydrolase [Emticicia sp. BO119]MBA4849217.1 PHP domain-containing protein [Emticicia sp. BO119]
MKKATYIFVLFCTGHMVLAQEPAKKWYKGNIHTHTRNSDGNTSIDSVINWYVSQKFDFMSITDHNKLSYDETLASKYNSEEKFLLIPGVEVTDRFEKTPVHLNGIGVSENVLPLSGTSVDNVIAGNLADISQKNGLGILNHPNGILKAAITSEQISRIKNLKFFEVCCADFKGGSFKPSTDEIWDRVLSKGKILYGVAADDAHNFRPYSKDPGSAWIMVNAEKLEQKKIIEAMEKGDFYATTGVIIRNYSIADHKIQIEIESNGYGFRTYFIGQNGKVLSVDESDNPTFKMKKKHKYVRCRIERSDGAYAWLQPNFY